MLLSRSLIWISLLIKIASLWLVALQAHHFNQLTISWKIPDLAFSYVLTPARCDGKQNKLDENALLSVCHLSIIAKLVEKLFSPFKLLSFHCKSSKLVHHNISLTWSQQTLNEIECVILGLLTYFCRYFLLRYLMALKRT